MNARLERAKEIPVVRVGPRQYMAGKHWVDLTEHDKCDCGDHLMKGTQLCKHVLACLLYEGETCI